MVVPLNKVDFDVLAKHYYPILKKHAEIECAKRNGNYTTAEEAVQDTMIAAWSKRDQARPGHFDAWIKQILTNKIRDSFRANRSATYTMMPVSGLKSKQTGASFDDEYVDTGADHWSLFHKDAPGDPAQLASANEIVRIIESLPANFRDVCKLTMIDGLDQLEIAAKLKIPLGTVQSRQHRSKSILQNKLKDMQ